MTIAIGLSKPHRPLLARCLGFVLSLGFVNAVFAGQGDLVLRLPAQTALKQRQFPVRTNEGLTNLIASVEALIRLSETQRKARFIRHAAGYARARKKQRCGMIPPLASFRLRPHIARPFSEP